MKVLIVGCICLLFASLSAATCDSIAASNYGGWKTVATAPHDGTIVEMLETYGVAPWYGLFRWTADSTAIDQNGKIVHFKTKPSWVSVDKPGSGVSEDSCLFWRPYKKSGKYSDPTGGAQESVAYWCAYMHRPYNKKKDVCE